MSHLGRLMLSVALWSAVAEFLLLRVFLRLGPFLPDQETLLPFYRLIEMLGLVALNLATLASAGFIVAVAGGQNWRRRGEVLVGLVLVGAALVNLSLGPLLAVFPAPQVTILQSGTTMGAVVAAAARRPRRGQVAIASIAAAQVCALYHVLTQGVAGMGLDLPGGGMPIFLAEALAVVSALMLPWSFRTHPRPAHAGVGLGLALVFMAAHAARPWAVATLTMWTVAFSLFLPGPIYAAGLGLATAAVLAMRKEPGSAGATPGLVLVALAGLKLDFTYFALLALGGLLATKRVAARSVPGQGSPRRDVRKLLSAWPAVAGHAARPGAQPLARTLHGRHQ